jgi:hypothetical protein
MEGGGLSVTSPFGVGLGQQFPFIGANPATGAVFTRTFDGNFARRILSLVFTVTAANAGSSRFVAVEYRGKDALPFAGGFPGSLLAINTANRYWGSVSRTVSDFATGTDVGFPLDDVFLFPGDQLVINITTLDSGDAITNIRGVEERFSYDPRRLPEALPE